MNPVRSSHIIEAILFSGACWYLSCGLVGQFWFLLWVAPIPILLLSVRLSGKKTFLVSFIAYLIGRLSWLHYLLAVVPLLPAVLFTLLLPLVFAFIILAVRRIMIIAPFWISVFAFPVFFSSYEFMLFLLSRDGTAGSIAYSQANCLPLIQIASLTGILGISFLVCFIPSSIACMIIGKKKRKEFNTLLLLFLSIIFATAIFGFIRIAKKPGQNGMSIGMMSINEKIYREPLASPDSLMDLKIANAYAANIAYLANRGANIVLIPEKALDLDRSAVTGIFLRAAKFNRVLLIVGCTITEGRQKKNMVVSISPDGQIISRYQKVNLYEGEVWDGYIPGKEIEMFNWDGLKVGVAICKDLDFQQFIRKYGKANAGILFVPAWDFTLDDWLHSRMAILRGVENGFSIVRNARLGRLTISDCRGKILQDSNCANGNETYLLGRVPWSVNDSTFYARTGDWFGWINLLAAICLLLFIYRKRSISPAYYKS